MKLKTIALVIAGTSFISACNNTGQTGSNQALSATSVAENVSQQGGMNSLTRQDWVNNLNPQDWMSDLKDEISQLPKADQDRLAEIHYYVRASALNLDKISLDSKDNPDNVERIKRLMPKDKFEKVFPLTAAGSGIRNNFKPSETYSYLNFLKAAAVVPGYCGNFEDYPEAGKTEEMKTDPDTICKRMLATTLAHAVQETSDVSSGSGIELKISGTFASVAENNFTPRPRNDKTPSYHDTAGPFTDEGSYKEHVESNNYYGRGAKQLSYPSNYANLSLMLYGNLLLLDNPDLVAENNILPYLSALVYALQPKSGRPSIAEVMDGSFKKYAKSGPAVEYAKMGFPYTIALVNGGPECTGENTANTKVRIEAFKYFATSGKLFTSRFTLTDSEATDENCDGINLDEISVTAASARPFYFYLDTNDNTCKLVTWDSGMPIFGGSLFEKAVCEKGAVVPAPIIIPKIELPACPINVQEWSSSSVYNQGDRVIYSGVEYEALWWTQGNVPTAGSPWGEPSACAKPDPTPTPTPAPSGDYPQYKAGTAYKG